MFKLNHRIKIFCGIICLLLCLCAGLHALERHELSFDELSRLDQQWASTSIMPDELVSLNGHAIKIRGFLYQQANTHWILASVPNIKSCCLDNDKVVGIGLKVDWLSTPQPTALAVFVMGSLHIDGQEVSTRLYRLGNAEIVSKNSFPWIYFALLGVLFVTGVAYKLWNRKKVNF